MRPNQILDLKNRKFNLLTVKEQVGRSKSGQVLWKCMCDCGKETIVSAYEINRNYIKSCGCLNFLSGNKHKNWKGYKEISSAFFTRIKNNSKKRNFEFNITIEYIWDLYEKQNRKCALTGLDINFGNIPYRYNKNSITASLDRIDSSKGYVIDNVQWVHKDINQIKQNFDELKFIEYCKLVVDYKKV